MKFFKDTSGSYSMADVSKSTGESRKGTEKPAAPAPSPAKDAGIAALISVLCMLILGAPAVGYFYLGNVRKGIIYLIASWVLLGVIVGIFVFGGILATLFTGLGWCCLLPILLVPLLFELLIVSDVYLEAKGEPTKLPSF